MSKITDYHSLNLGLVLLITIHSNRQRSIEHGTWRKFIRFNLKYSICYFSSVGIWKTIFPIKNNDDKGWTFEIIVSNKYIIYFWLNTSICIFVSSIGQPHWFLFMNSSSIEKMIRSLVIKCRVIKYHVCLQFKRRWVGLLTDSQTNRHWGLQSPSIPPPSQPPSPTTDGHFTRHVQWNKKQPTRNRWQFARGKGKWKQISPKISLEVYRLSNNQTVIKSNQWKNNILLIKNKLVCAPHYISLLPLLLLITPNHF